MVTGASCGSCANSTMTDSTVETHAVAERTVLVTAALGTMLAPLNSTMIVVAHPPIRRHELSSAGGSPHELVQGANDVIRISAGTDVYALRPDRHQWDRVLAGQIQVRQIITSTRAVAIVLCGRVTSCLQHDQRVICWPKRWSPQSLRRSTMDTG